MWYVTNDNGLFIMFIHFKKSCFFLSVYMFVYLILFRVSQGLLALRAIEGLQVDKVIQVSMDQRVKKVTGATPASLVQKEMW